MLGVYLIFHYITSTPDGMDAAFVLILTLSCTRIILPSSVVDCIYSLARFVFRTLVKRTVDPWAFVKSAVSQFVV